MDTLLSLIPVLVVRIPVFFVWAVAGVLALANLGRRRTVSVLVLVAVAILIVADVVGTSASVWMPSSLLHRGWSTAELGTAMAVVSGVSSCFHAIGYGLLVGNRSGVVLNC